MANQMLSIKELARLTLPRLLENLVFPNLCYRDLEQDFTGHKLGDTIQVRKPINLVAHDFDPVSGVVNQAINEDTVDFCLNRIATVDVNIEALEGVAGSESLEQLFIQPAAAALAEKINQEGLKLYKDVYTAVGLPGKTPSTLAEFTAARKALNQNKAPLTGRCAVWDPEADASFSALDALVNADKCGNTQALREGSIGRVMGFDNYMSQGVIRHKSAITAAVGVKVNGAVTAGATTVSIDGTNLVGKLSVGDIITIAGKTYVITEDSADAVNNAIENVKVWPPLPAVKDNADASVAGTHTANLAFCPMAFAFATRPLVAPAGVESYVTGYNGVSLRVVRGYDMQHKRELLSMDVLYGFKTLYPELAVRVMG